MLQPGGGMVISGGTFIQQNQTAQGMHQCHEADDGFKHLQAHVAPTAYATQQAGDAPKCHPNTRTAVLDDIWNWIILFSTRTHWALWLYGAAGAGKSAIGRSIVDRCLLEQVVIARFFFFRTDPSRNTINPVVATLLNQLIKQIPDLVSIVIPQIQSDPLIFMQSFETQFETLIYEPLLLVDSFADIHVSHPFKHLIPPEWPAPALVQEIVTKSSGQFIYASVVIKFISAPRSNPASQLDIVRGLKPAGSLTPFAQLDALYSHILSQVPDFDLTASVLTFCIFGISYRDNIAIGLDMSPDAVFLALADLLSVISSDRHDQQIEFLHASLPDFLLDPTRSGQYHIDRTTRSTQILMNWLRIGRNTRRYLPYIEPFLDYVKPTPELRMAFVTFHNWLEDHHDSVGLFPVGLSSHWAYYLQILRRLNFGDALNQQALITCIRSLLNNGETVKSLERAFDKFDIADILAHIRIEQAAERVAKAQHWEYEEALKVPSKHSIIPQNGTRSTGTINVIEETSEPKHSELITKSAKNPLKHSRIKAGLGRIFKR